MKDKIQLAAIALMFLVIIVLSIMFNISLRRIDKLEQNAGELKIQTILIADSVATSKNTVVQHKMDSSNTAIDKRIRMIKVKSGKQDEILHRIDSIGWKPPIL